jgi:nicotinate phosphoribosyltransferase
VTRKTKNKLESGLFTDLYQLTMAHGYWHAGIAERTACFHLFFRSNPFCGGYSVACGLQQALEHLDGLEFTGADIEYLARQTGSDGEPLFRSVFLGWLQALEFQLDIDAIPEGTVVFPGEPLVRVVGPIAQCQLIETALLNIINFQTLIATKASRVCGAAQGDPVIEFGLRRAQGPDGGLSASRAAYIGGCVGTSNTLAGRIHGIPVGGTHAHSWVMAFDSEVESFEAYAAAMPGNCTFLVDTYDTLKGVRNACEVGARLRELGSEMVGIRIDSGDLAWFSIRAREILDANGFPDAVIVASNELDEHLIVSLKDQGAAIDVWGVGTKLATAFDQPALGGVYKLAAIQGPDKEWEPRIKVSEQTVKATTPGLLGARRYLRDSVPVGDMVYDVRTPPPTATTMIDPADPTRHKAFPPDAEVIDLLEPVMRDGAVVGDPPSIVDIRDRAFAQVASLDPGHTRFLNPHTYPVGLAESVNDQRTSLILKARAASQ